MESADGNRLTSICKLDRFVNFRRLRGSVFSQTHGESAFPDIIIREMSIVNFNYYITRLEIEFQNKFNVFVV